MSVRSLLARAFTAAAAAGIAIAAPAVGAGAATTPPPPIISITPVGVSVNLGTRPVVTIGGAPASGVHATVPVAAHGAETVGRPALPAAAGPVLGAAGPAPAPAAPVLGALPAGDRLVDADVALHACVAVALLDGADPLGCVPAGSATPSLADALAQVGLCAHAAVLASGPVAPCGATTTTRGATPAVSPSLLGLDANADVCAAATVLGLVDPSRCSDPASDSGSAATPGGSRSSGSTDDTTDATPVQSTEDVCLGLAVLTSGDATRCGVVAAADNPGGSGDSGDTGATPAVLAETASGAGHGLVATDGSGGGLAFTGVDTLFFVMTGLGSIVIGLALRRSVRAGRAG